ncbi:translation initiation factor IF-2-like [Acinonyx jubatus]|uniref:Translation initiation factor IF-2-like n=1 Tax=Acinonyx jubatus TaxID=32536 RepID=A0ABM3ND10_ACIJB|nr:translation initiation factor IF-2-like [Acinonyx jubatus]
MAVQKLQRLLAGVQSRLSASYNHTSQSYTHTHTHSTHTDALAGGRCQSQHPPAVWAPIGPRTHAGESRAERAAHRRGPGPRETPGRAGPGPVSARSPPSRPATTPRSRRRRAQEERTGSRGPPARPGPAAPLRFPPLRPARGVLALLHDPGGHISLRRDSSLPALVPRRQAGACSRGRTPSETHTAPGRWLAPGRIPGWGGPRRVAGAKPPRPPPGWHKSAGGRAGGIGRRHLPRGVGLTLGAADLQPGVPARAQGWRLQPRSVGSPAALFFAISLSFSPSLANSSLQKTFSLRFGPTSLLPSDSARRGRAKAAGAAVSERKTQKWLLA